MEYGQQVLARLLQPGMLLLVLGAVCVYASSKIAGKWFDGDEKKDIIIKVIGCAVALLGTMMVFM